MRKTYWDIIERAERMSKIEPDEIYAEAVKVMKPDEIDHHGNGKGLDDLYLKVTPESVCLTHRLTTRSLISTFRSSKDNSLWFELPFCYPVNEGGLHNGSEV